MSTNLEAIKARIRKCLNLAEDDGAMEGEIDNALRFARKLMLQHNVTEDEVRADDAAKSVHEIAAEAERTEYGRESFQSQGSKLTAWERTLVYAVLDLIGTVNWYRSGTETRRSPAGTVTINPVTGQPCQAVRLVLYGPAEDVRDARDLVLEWALTITSLARLKHGGALRGPGRSYAEGYAQALADKVREIRREERAEVKRMAQGGDLELSLLGTGTDEQKAMILADRGSALAVSNAHALIKAKEQGGKDWLENECGIKLHKTGRSAGGGGHFGGAYGEGRKDGSKASFSHKRTPKLGG